MFLPWKIYEVFYTALENHNIYTVAYCFSVGLMLRLDSATLDYRQTVAGLTLEGFKMAYIKIHDQVFLAHLSRRLTGELIGYPWIRRPASSVHIFKHLLP